LDIAPVVSQKTTPEEILAALPEPALAKAESQLRRAWNLLPPSKQVALEDEQVRWLQIEENSKGEVKLRMLRERTMELLKKMNRRSPL
jgi:hypothetical protein